MSDILEKILAVKRAEIAAAKQRLPLSQFAAKPRQQEGA